MKSHYTTPPCVCKYQTPDLKGFGNHPGVVYRTLRGAASALHSILGTVKIHVLTTGGTIEKVYSEQSGTVQNVVARINPYVERLRLPDTMIEVTQLMNKDSLEMTDEDREQILEAVRARVADSPVVITHGTDTMVETGRMLKQKLFKSGAPQVAHPVILTGAMTPLGFERSDGLQNLTESLFAARTLTPGVWIVLHNQALDVDHVRKDRELARFVAAD